MTPQDSYYLHDSLFKSMLEDPEMAGELLALFMSDEELALFAEFEMQATTYIDPRDGSEKRLDAHAKCVLLGVDVEIRVVYEHKSSPDERTFTQVKSYYLWVQGQGNVLVIVVVFYHGRDKGYHLPKDDIEFMVGGKLEEVLGSTPKLAKRLAGHISSFSLNFINIHNYDDIYIRQRLPTCAPWVLALKHRENIDEDILWQKIQAGRSVPDNKRSLVMNAVVDYTERVTSYDRGDFTRIELERSPTTQKQEVLMQRIKLGNERIREEGRQEGQREGVERIALRMLADRIDDKDIIRLTKLTAQQLAELKKRA